MFENFTFHQKADSNVVAGSLGDDDPPLSPRQSPVSGSLSPQLRPSLTQPVPDDCYNELPPLPLARGNSIELLTEELSKQSLKAVENFRTQTFQLSPAALTSSVTKTALEPAPLVPNARIQAGTQSRLLSPHPTTTSPPHLPRLQTADDLTSSEYTQPEDVLGSEEPDMTRLRRQMHAQFTNNPSNARTIQSLMEDMIATGTQCNVYDTLPPTPSSTSRLQEASTYIPATPIEVDKDTDELMGGMGLEVDPTYSGQDDEAIMAETFSLRRAHMLSAASRQSQAPDVPRWRMSAEAAAQCPKLVRNRPRMRKRKMFNKTPRSTSIASTSTAPPPTTTAAASPLASLAGPPISTL